MSPKTIAILLLFVLATGQTSGDCRAKIEASRHVEEQPIPGEVRGTRWLLGKQDDPEPIGVRANGLHDYRIGGNNVLYAFEGDGNTGDITIPQPFEEWNVVDAYGPGPHLTEPEVEVQRWTHHYADAIQESHYPDLSPGEARWSVVYNRAACSIEVPMSEIALSVLSSFQAAGEDFTGYRQDPEGKAAFWFADAAIDLQHNPQATEVYVITKPRDEDGPGASIPNEVRSAICINSHWTLRKTDLRWNVDPGDDDTFWQNFVQGFGKVFEAFNIGECNQSRHLNLNFCGELIAMDGGVGFVVWEEMTSAHLQPYARIRVICNNQIKPAVEASFVDVLNNSIGESAGAAAAGALNGVPWAIKRVTCAPDRCFVVVAETRTDKTDDMQFAGVCAPHYTLDRGVDPPFLTSRPIMTSDELEIP